MDTITTRIFIDNVFLILQRRNIPGITLDNLRLVGKEFQELCRNKDVKTDIWLSGEEFDDFLAKSNCVERHLGTPSLIRIKPGAALGRKYAEYLPLRATIALSIDLPKIIEKATTDEAPKKSA